MSSLITGDIQDSIRELRDTVSRLEMENAAFKMNFDAQHKVNRKLIKNQEIFTDSSEIILKSLKVLKTLIN